jgi:multidrug transporter EmrE-like cation transporter
VSKRAVARRGYPEHYASEWKDWLNQSMSPVVAKTVGVYVLLALAGALGAVGDALLNQWVRTSRISWLIPALSLWIIACFLFVLLLKLEYFGFSGAVLLALLIHSILAVFLDRLWFNGRVTPAQWMGFLFAFAAIVLIEIGRSASPTPPRDAPAGQLTAGAR